MKDIDMKCLNCGRSGHKTWQCPESDNVTASIICTACGGVGHIVKDCKARRPGEVFNQSSGGAELDGEYTGDDDNDDDDNVNKDNNITSFPGGPGCQEEGHGHAGGQAVRAADGGPVKDTREAQALHSGGASHVD